MRFLLQFMLTIALAWAASRLAGRLFKQRHTLKIVPATAAVSTAVGIWFAVTWWARGHAETDLNGWPMAEGWAYSGKWYGLLAGATFALSFVQAFETKRVFGRRKTLRIVVCTLFVLLVLLRVMPVYWLVDTGERDSDGFLRQSKRFEYTCGVVALANYLEFYRGHPPITEREITRVCRTTSEGSTTANLLRAAHHYGITNASARTLTWEELGRINHPVIVSISTLPNMLHATLLVEIHRDKLTFIDPAYGKWTISPERFKEIWRGKTILLQ